MKSIALAALALAALSAGQAQAREPAPMRNAGVLTCAFDVGLGLVIGSVRGADCTYDRHDRRGRLIRESYLGTLSRAGLDLGVTSGQTITWNVITSGGRSRPGMLTRAFDGSAADLTVLAGPGTHTMMSDAGERIALQPVSVSGQVGLGLSLGATDLKLQQVAIAR